jgi:ribosomal protein S18 acetylase RimI-like enzyme
MNASDFPAFFETASNSYARDNAASGRWPEHDAPSLAREETKRLLALDEKTPDNFLFVLHASGASTDVGYLWYGTHVRGASRVAFLFQLYIHEQYRRQGYGRQALLAFERHALNAGHDALALNVFASNQGALLLYESAGYSPTSIGMRKLPARSDA